MIESKEIIMAKAAKKSFAVIVMVVVAIAMLMPALTQEARADDFNTAKYKKKVTVYKDYVPVWLNMGSKVKGAKKMTAKSSSTSVVKINKYALDDRMVVFDTKKKGKATVTIKIKKKSGTRTYKCKVKVVGYSTPAKSVKVAKKSYTKKFKKKTKYFTRKPESKKEKVIVQCKSGWAVKIRHVWYTDDFHTKTVKNGSNVTYRQNAEFEYISFTFYNKSRNYTIEKRIDITW